MKLFGQEGPEDGTDSKDKKMLFTDSGADSETYSAFERFTATDSNKNVVSDQNEVLYLM